MTAQILVVDDVPANVKLLEAKLTSEYYDVIAARDGFEAVKMAKETKPDLILLDVMMPGMDGFETCRRMKEDPEISHIPVVMVTALSEQSDRVRGLEAGADDFLTKPINDMALFARVKSLVRIKVLLDELRLRDQTRAQLGVDAMMNSFTSDVSGSRVLLIDDDPIQGKQLKAALSGTYTVEWLLDPAKSLENAVQGDFDAILVNTLLSEVDGLRLATQIKGREEIRHVPVLMLVDEDDTRSMLKGLEMGINDYLRVPVDKNEMTARVQTQIRRKKYQEVLRSTYQQSMSLAITDGLTGLYNRHYLNTHLENTVRHSVQSSKALALLIMDMDHFKFVNDTYGHDAGDRVLKQLAEILLQSSRSADLVARYGGEEFVVLLPETDPSSAREVAERIRKAVESHAFVIDNEGNTIRRTISIGGATFPAAETAAAVTSAELLKIADIGLYQAKNGGRNQVVM